MGEQVASGEEAFTEVARDDFIRIADGGEIHAGIPVLEYIDVCRYMKCVVVRQLLRAGVFKKWRQEFGNSSRIHAASIHN